MTYLEQHQPALVVEIQTQARLTALWAELDLVQQQIEEAEGHAPRYLYEEERTIRRTIDSIA